MERCPRLRVLECGQRIEYFEKSKKMARCVHSCLVTPAILEAEIGGSRF
jgi:hypothetical protein